MWKTFSYTTKNVQSYNKWKAEDFNEQHWLGLVVGSNSIPDDDAVHPDEVTLAHTQYGMRIGAAPKPLQVQEVFPPISLDFHLDQAQGLHLLKQPETGGCSLELNCAG